MRGGSVSRSLLIALALTSVALPIAAGPDPMRPPSRAKPVQVSKPVAMPAQWHLTLIRQEGASRSALINGKLVRVGSRVGGATVAAIGKSQAILRLPDARSVKLLLPSLQLRKDYK
jgi:hypothetical protein